MWTKGLICAGEEMLMRTTPQILNHHRTPHAMYQEVLGAIGRVHRVARLGATPSLAHPASWRCTLPQKALRAESSGIKTTGGKPKEEEKEEEEFIRIQRIL